MIASTQIAKIFFLMVIWVNLALENTA